MLLSGEFIQKCFISQSLKGNVYVLFCSCVDGYTGENCEDLVDNCKSGPCMNNATCINSLNNYSCECKNGKKTMLDLMTHR